MAIQNHQRHTGQTSDGLSRTEFFQPDVLPTIPGSYECSTGSGHIFRRTYDGANWISPVNGLVSTVRMLWRGVQPGSVDIKLYPSTARVLMHTPPMLVDAEIELRKQGFVPSKSDMFSA